MKVHFVAGKMRLRQCGHQKRASKIKKCICCETQMRLRQCGHQRRASEIKKYNCWRKKAPSTGVDNSNAAFANAAFSNAAFNAAF